MGKETGISEALKESLAMMASFHLNAFLSGEEKDWPPEVRCTNKWIQRCKGCSAAKHFRKAQKLLTVKS